MPRFLVILTTALIFISCSSADKKTDPAKAGISISIEQNGHTVLPDGNTVRLRRGPFNFTVKFTGPDGILVHASFNDTTYTKAEAGLPIEELPGFSSTSMAEELFNSESLLYVSEKAPSYWYYTDQSDHRFNSVTPAEGGFLCRRDVFSIVDVDSGMKSHTPAQIKGDSIYIVILKTDWTSDFTRRIELDRKVIKITFNI